MSNEEAWFDVFSSRKFPKSPYSFSFLAGGLVSLSFSSTKFGSGECAKSRWGGSGEKSQIDAKTETVPWIEIEALGTYPVVSTTMDMNH